MTEEIIGNFDSCKEVILLHNFHILDDILKVLDQQNWKANNPLTLWVSQLEMPAFLCAGSDETLCTGWILRYNRLSELITAPDMLGAEGLEE